MTYDATLRRFKAAIRKGDTPPVGLVRKAASLSVASMEDRQVKFTVSTPNVDRDNDVIALDGWDLKSYMQNPVVLWGHDHGQLPIGKCTAIGAEDGELRAIVDFVPADMPVVGGMAEAVLRMCRAGFLSTTSVGFRPTEFKMAAERMAEDDWFPPIDFLKHELLEWSIVSIPANPEALIDPAERQLLNSPEATAAAAALAAAVSEQIDKLATAHARRRLLRAACV